MEEESSAHCLLGAEDWGTLQLVGAALPTVSVLGVHPPDRKNFPLTLSETVKSLSSLPLSPTHILKVPFFHAFLSTVSAAV